jgi:hypothetical protein
MGFSWEESGTMRGDDREMGERKREFIMRGN